MHWNELVGHKVQHEWFARAMGTGRLASTFLFIGPEGIGKRTFARMLAKCWLCRQTSVNHLDACGHCEDCAQVEASTHPDLIEVAKPVDKAFLPLELLIGDVDQRMREGLCHDISLKPFGGRRKVAIIDDADALNAEGANALLKTLEEPPDRSVLILIGTSLQRQLPTIRSRCQTVLFQPLSTNELSQLLVLQGIAQNQLVADRLASSARGSIQSAIELSDPELREHQSNLFSFLTGRPMAMQELAKCCAAAVDSAGKEAKVKRQRLKLLLGMSADFYRSMALATHSSRPDELASVVQDRFLLEAVYRFLPTWLGGTGSAVECWQVCLRAIEDVDRNVNQATLLEWWAAELASCSAS